MYWRFFLDKQTPFRNTLPCGKQVLPLVERLLTDTTLRRKVIPAARKHLQEQFDSRRLTREWAQLYRLALGGKTNGGIPSAK